MGLEIISKTWSKPQHPHPLVFVHGLWVNLWGWQEHFLNYFYQQGFDVYAFSLRGHGQSSSRVPLRWVRLADYVEDLGQVVQSIPGAPVLIGHSNGGMIVQKYLEHHHDIPAAVLLASIPPSGIWRPALIGALKFPWSFLRANLTMSLLPLVDTPQKARYQFFSDGLPEALVQRYQNQMHEESFLEFLDVLLFNLPHPKQVTTRMLILGGEKDTAFPPSLVKATAQAYHAETYIFPGIAHGMMLEPGWDLVANKIIQWLENQKLT